MKTRLLLVLAAFAVTTPAFAQLAAPNAAGVAIGHMHINAADVDAQSRFWTTVGGTIVQREKITMVQFPGIYILLRKQDSSGGSVGSTINHFGFFVRDFEASVAKWKAAGLTWEPVTNPQVGQGFLTGPDGVRIELYENKSISAPLQMHHIHLFVPDQTAAQKWYVDNFGAIAGKRAAFETANVPGTEITMAKAERSASADQGALGGSHGLRGEEHRRLRRQAAGRGHQDRRPGPQQHQRRGYPAGLRHRSVGD